MNITKRKIKLNLQIKPYNIDAAGHVNNAVYINWFEDLRTELFEDCFNFRKLYQHKVYPVVITTDIVYKKFLKLFDKPIGTMCIECCKHNIYTLKAEIILNDKIFAYGTQKCIMFDLENSKIMKDCELQEISPFSLTN